MDSNANAHAHGIRLLDIKAKTKPYALNQDCVAGETSSGLNLQHVLCFISSLYRCILLTWCMAVGGGWGGWRRRLGQGVVQVGAYAGIIVRKVIHPHGVGEHPARRPAARCWG